MEQERFDRLARSLGAASTRRSALGALAGIGIAAAARGVEAKKTRKRRCDPACAAGQTCRHGTCTCDNGAAVCGTSCCTGGQRCEGGRCAAMPAPGQCAALGAACVDTGVPCCEGTVCGSGQGGEHDVACYVPAGGPCATTAECVYDSTCTQGVCVARHWAGGDTCRSACAAGETCCDGTCADLQADDANCGACGTTCGARASCQAGTCIPCTVCASGCRFTTIEGAIAAAASGDTITVAPGTYTPVPGDPVDNYRGYLSIQNTRIVLRSCDAAGTVTVKCPSLSSDPTVCVRVLPGGGLDLDGFFLDGVSINPQLTSRGFSLEADGASATLTNVTASAFKYNFNNLSSAATLVLGRGVTTANWKPLGGYGIYNAGGSVTCTAAVTFEPSSGSGDRCSSGTGGSIGSTCGCDV